MLALLSVTVISLISLIGVLVLSIDKNISKRKLMYLVSFSVGGLLGGAFFHLLPESLEKYNVKVVSVFILSGIFVSFFIEMVLNWRHCHIPTSMDHPHTFVYMNLIGDGVHNFIDGLIVGGAFLVDINLGFATSLAIILHEIPQEIGDYGVLVYGGMRPRKALYLNLCSGLTAIFGALIALALNNFVDVLTGYLLPFAVGNFLYIAGSDLVPELKDEKDLGESLIQLFVMIVGVILLYALTFVELH